MIDGVLARQRVEDDRPVHLGREHLLKALPCIVRQHAVSKYGGQVEDPTQRRSLAFEATG
jgi:hypothetical protein